MSKLKGTSLVGGSVSFERAENDFYATDPKSVLSLLAVEDFNNGVILEPCCGQGHISKILKAYTNSDVASSDIVDRGYGDGQIDFLNKNSTFMDIDYIVTNPPFKLAKEFVDKSLKIATKKVAMFLKIQFLEGQSRKEWFKNTPLKTVYVFSKRQVVFNNGDKINPKTGKAWANTMCFCWFVWEIGYTGKPQIEWI